MMMRDNMIMSLSKGVLHGCCVRHSPSVRGHLRPLNNRSGSLNIMWPRLLDDVGATVGEGRNTSNLRIFRVSSGQL